MKSLVVGEHSRLVRGVASRSLQAGGVELDARAYERLRRYDCHGRAERDRVFDWRDGYALTRQWVGVVQVPGLQLEILPKVDAFATASENASTGIDGWHSARSNLLYMLAIGGEVPVRSRDMARLGTRRAALSETLVAIFAERLQGELLRGRERTYLQREDNLRAFKGKLMVSQHERVNAAHRERFYCQFQELSDDTGMNRIFKATCRALLLATVTPATQDVLKRCLLLLEAVSEVEVRPADFATITINRQNERFEELIRFCELVLAGRSPTIEAGQSRTFSLLFDMNKVFERFIAACIARFVAPRFAGMRVHVQARGHRRFLMHSEGVGVLRLEPDILIELGEHKLVMDTKWKLLRAAKRGLGGVADGDLYQLFAYTRRYGARRSVLLYPRIQGLAARDFDVLDAGDARTGEQVAVRHVDLHRNFALEAERSALHAELEAVVRAGLDHALAEAS